MHSANEAIHNRETTDPNLDLSLVKIISKSNSPRHPYFFFFFSFFSLSAGALPSPVPPPISFIISLNILSLTPPPDNAGECNGNISLIFHPLGTAGGGGGLSGCGIPANRNNIGVSGVVGCSCNHV